MKSALAFLREHGEVKTDELARRAGTTLAYFKQIAYQHRRPSSGLAKRLAAESAGELDAAQLVLAELKEPKALRMKGDADLHLNDSLSENRAAAEPAALAPIQRE